MSPSGATTHVQALEDFRRARQKANLDALMARLRGESDRLLSYDEVRQKLKVENVSSKKLQDIPLENIVGSVNRYEDFNRNFLPKRGVDPNRWAGVIQAVSDVRGLPPIDVYQVGQAYFVSDGNHRVSVARQLGAKQIQAYVTEVRTRVALTPEDTPDDLILKAEYAEFLEATRLDRTRPQADLSLTAPGQYDLLKEHIMVHRYYMGVELKQQVSEEEAAAHWYDTVYLPLVQIIRSQDLLCDFPERSETDLYLWLSEHRADLERDLGESVDIYRAASHLARARGSTRQRILARISEKLLDLVVPDPLASGPPAGAWRQEAESLPNRQVMFNDILVPLSGSQASWQALEQALVIAGREGSRLHGLHVSRRPTALLPKARLNIKPEFERRLAQASQDRGIQGGLAFERGRVIRHIIQRSVWNDLLVVNLSHPPGQDALQKLRSGFRQLVLRCPIPILALPGRVAPLERALLAYDGSPKAREALYVATYLAGCWAIPLVVLTVWEGDQEERAIVEEAAVYLEEHGVQATYVQDRGPIPACMLITAEEQQCDFIIMGGYGSAPLVNIFVDDVVDQILRQSRKPMLLCR